MSPPLASLKQTLTSSGNAGSGSSSGLLSVLEPIVSRTGYALPALVLAVLVLCLMYPDRALFTPAFRANVPTFPAPVDPKTGKRPKGMPLIGHTYYMVKNGPNRTMHRLKDLSDGSPQGVCQQSVIGLGNQVMLFRPEYIEAVQKTHFENFVKGPAFMIRFRDILGAHGIFVADGETWKMQRKRASHIFSRGQFTNWVQTVVHGELRLVTALLDEVARRESTRRNHVMLTDLFFRYTLASFSKMAYSADMKCLTASPECLDTPVEFSVAFDLAQAVVNERFVFPFFQIRERFSKRGQEMREAVQQLRKTGMEIISERLEGRMAEDRGEKREKRAIEKDGKDLLDLFMDMTQDPEDLLQIVNNFLIAGRDTTAQSLSWLFVELFKRPDVVAEMRREIEAVCGDEMLKYDDVKKLPYTQATVAEAIRLHPAVPKNGKVCVKDTLIQPSGPNPDNLPPVLIRKGEWASWSDWAMARRTDVWGPDAEDFKPERFLEIDANGQRSYINYSNWQYHSFNGMPRLCLGMNLAFFEAMAFCVAALPRFDFRYTSKQDGQTVEYPPTYVNSVTLPSEPYLATVSARR